jgi:hypothetical protein
MTDFRPRISVIVPAYNQARYLGAAIESALNQTLGDLEVVVVNDGSTDGTEEVVRSCTDPRMRYVHQANAGLSAARNTGISQAQGEYLSFLDADDLLLPEKHSSLVAEMEADPHIGLAAGQAIPIDEHGRPTGHIFDVPLPEDLSRLVLRNPLHVGSVLVRRDWLKRVGIFDERVRSHEDWDLWLRLARSGCGMRWVARPVSCYRFHDRQMIRDGDMMTAASMAVLDKHFGDPELPPSWRGWKNQAYSNAHLRAAANQYVTARFPSAAQHLLEAVNLNPELAAHDSRLLREHISAWTDLPKTGDRLAFLETVYAQVPEHLIPKAQRYADIGQIAFRIALEADDHGDRALARAAVWTALRARPAWLVNRGVVSILLRTFLPAKRIRTLPATGRASPASR